MRLRLLTLTAIGLALLSTAVTLRGQSAASWLQWGGPTRNFVSDSKGLASTWPAAGPKKLWSRMLGEGHSSIVAENGRLTIHGTGEDFVTEVIRYLGDERVRVADFRTVLPTLEDVFLKVTGHSIRD